MNNNVKKNPPKKGPAKKNPAKNFKKSLSRLMAIQIFYQFHFFNKSQELQQIKEDIVNNYLLNVESDISSYSKKIDNNFLEKLITGLEFKITEIDQEISNFLKNDWTFDKLDDITKEILRLATLELQVCDNIPAKVIIDEYVDIAASFFDNKKVTFVNATIDNLARKIRSKEFDTKFSKKIKEK